MDEAERTIKVLPFVGARLDYIQEIVEVEGAEYFAPQPNHLRRRPNAYKKYKHRFKRRVNRTNGGPPSRRTKRRTGTWYFDSEKYSLFHQYISKRFHMEGNYFHRVDEQRPAVLIPTRAYGKSLSFFYKTLRSIWKESASTKFLYADLNLYRVVRRNICSSTDRESYCFEQLCNCSSYKGTDYIVSKKRKFMEKNYVELELFDEANNSLGPILLIRNKAKLTWTLICHFLSEILIVKQLDSVLSTDLKNELQTKSVVVHLVGEHGLQAATKYLTGLNFDTTKLTLEHKGALINEDFIIVLTEYSIWDRHEFASYRLILLDAKQHMNILDFLGRNNGVIFGIEFHHSLKTSCQRQIFPLDHPNSHFHQEYWVNKAEKHIQRLKKLPLSKIGYRIQDIKDICYLFSPNWALVMADGNENELTDLLLVSVTFTKNSGRRILKECFHIVYNNVTIGFVTSVNGSQRDLYCIDVTSLGFVSRSKLKDLKFDLNSTKHFLVQLISPKRIALSGTKTARNNLAKSSEGVITFIY